MDRVAMDELPHQLVVLGCDKGSTKLLQGLFDAFMVHAMACSRMCGHSEDDVDMKMRLSWSIMLLTIDQAAGGAIPVSIAA